MTQVHSFCRMCQAMCGIVVHVDGARVVRVTGDPDHPVSAGYTCPKGRSLPAVHHDPARLADPEWEATLDGLAARLAEVIERHGPGAVGAYRATHWAFDAAGRVVADRFFRALPTRQLYSAVTVDAPNKTLVPDLVAGTPFLFPQADWEAARLLLVIGQNPIVSHGHTVARPNAVVALRQLQARGGAVVVADPRLTETARLADVHLAVRPGSDPALLAGLIRAVLHGRPASLPGRPASLPGEPGGTPFRAALTGGAADTAFLDEAADPASVERLARLVEPFTPAVVAERCGVDRALVDETIRRVLAAGRVAIQTGTGVSMGAAPNAGEWLAWALGAVTGSLDRAGGVVFNPGVLRPQEERLVTRPRHEPGADPASRPDLRFSYGEVPCTALADEIDAGHLRALFVLGGNPLATLPDSDRLRRSFATLDVLAVCDIVPTETTAVATHVLPVAGQLERADLTSFLDGYFPFPFVQYTPAAVPAPPGRPPMWAIFAGLGRRLGLPGFAGADPEPDAASRPTGAGAPPPGVPSATVSRSAGARAPSPGQTATGTDRPSARSETNTDADATPAGDARAGTTTHPDAPGDKDRGDPAADAGGDGDREEALLAGVARRARVPWEEIRAAPSGVAPTGTPGPGWLIPGRLPRGRLDLAPAELVDQFEQWCADGPPSDGLVLVNRRELRQTNSMLRDPARPPALLMHPDDAARLGLRAGQAVAVTAATGSTTATLDVTGSIRPGTVSLPHGWSTPGVNRLTSSTADVEPLTGMPRLSGIAVEVAAAPPAPDSSQPPGTATPTFEEVPEP